ncbi:NUDIX hydrolase [Paenibacillus oleatilyticus]|uniref:NUDIX hydrolase n=1 Tax=Paenibacillus oleatilyticus TaxID=2594886 RepID=UPI001C1FB20B|nr:NUDIX domain-containing protein [Paenibacillus oleatilyticus]MBU7317151.1 NUDIX domain-containing protein [Paenibacillus oleatilyticus]
MPITIKNQNEEFLLRVAGVLIKENKVLLHKTKKGNAWVLPGGRGEINEETGKTVIREFAEELGLNVKVARLLWIVENFNAYGEKNLHEHGIYYLVNSEEAEITIRTEEFIGLEKEIGIVYKWIELQELHNMKIYPGALKQLLQNISEDNEIKHIINTEES